MADAKLSRRDREKLRQRGEILAASLALFSEKGYNNVSMHEIAAKAEFATGTLYKFFRNKGALYRAIMLELIDKFHDDLSGAIQASDDEIEKLRNFVKGKVELFRANAPMVRLYVAETRGGNYSAMADLDSEIRDRHHRVMHDLAAVFERGIKAKRFQRIADPYHLAIALDSLTTAFLFIWLDAPGIDPALEDPDMILNIFFKGLIPS